jgi:hypothetical protein
MVTLVNTQTKKVIDKKILPVDIYSCTLAAGMYDLDLFCEQ